MADMRRVVGLFSLGAIGAVEIASASMNASLGSVSYPSVDGVAGSDRVWCW